MIMLRSTAECMSGCTLVFVFGYTAVFVPSCTAVLTLEYTAVFVLSCTEVFTLGYTVVFMLRCTVESWHIDQGNGTVRILFLIRLADTGYFLGRCGCNHTTGWIGPHKRRSTAVRKHSLSRT